MRVYVYDGIEYTNVESLRKVIWRKANIIFGHPKSAEEWAKLGVELIEKTPTYTIEQMARQVRFQRDRLLSACDYYVMPDYPSIEDGLVEVKAYRQALRDITKQDGFPTMVVWPVKPSVLG